MSANIVEASWRALVDSVEYKLSRDGVVPILGEQGGSSAARPSESHNESPDASLKEAIKLMNEDLQVMKFWRHAITAKHPGHNPVSPELQIRQATFPTSTIMLPALKSITAVNIEPGGRLSSCGDVIFIGHNWLWLHSYRSRPRTENSFTVFHYLRSN